MRGGGGHPLQGGGCHERGGGIRCKEAVAMRGGGGIRCKEAVAMRGGGGASAARRRLP